jgi:hypothetical protein
MEISPVSILNVVDFPEPFIPNKPKHSPGLTPTHVCLTAVKFFPNIDP